MFGNRNQLACCVSWTGSHYIAQAGLNSESSCLYFPGAGITGSTTTPKVLSYFLEYLSITNHVFKISTLIEKKNYF
jgi:hypothetical protein